MSVGYEPGQRPAREDELRMMVEANAFPPITKGKPWLTAILSIAGVLAVSLIVMKAGSWLATHSSNTSAMAFTALLYILFFAIIFGWSRGNYWKRVGNLRTEGVMVRETILSKDEVKSYSSKKKHMLYYPSVINDNAGRCIIATCGDTKKYLPYAEDWQRARSDSYVPAS